MSVWPVTVPHIAEANSMRVAPFRAPHQTDMEDGDQRRRRSTTKNIATISFAIRMVNAEFEVFKVWVRDDLVDGTLPFTMPVWTGSAYQVRTCSIPGGRYEDDPTKGTFHEIRLTLDVEDY